MAGHELGERHRWYRLRIRPLHELLLIAGPADQPIGDDGARCDQGNGPDQRQRPGRKGLEGRRRHDALRSNQAAVGSGCMGKASAGLRSDACTMLNMVGTRNRVAQVAKSRPPITARPRGAFWLGSTAIGIMPMIIASAVMSTGRKRVLPASIAAVIGSAPSARRSPAKLITRRLLAVPTALSTKVHAGARAARAG